MKTTINKKLRGIAAALLLIGLVPSNMMAQDKVEASVGADLVSGYIWRGQDLGGVSNQPSLGISYKGLSLGACKALPGKCDHELCRAEGQSSTLQPHPRVATSPPSALSCTCLCHFLVLAYEREKEGEKSPCWLSCHRNMG